MSTRSGSPLVPHSPWPITSVPTMSTHAAPSGTVDARRHVWISRPQWIDVVKSARHGKNTEAPDGSRLTRFSTDCRSHFAPRLVQETRWLWRSCQRCRARHGSRERGHASSARSPARRGFVVSIAWHDSQFAVGEGNWIPARQRDVRYLQVEDHCSIAFGHPGWPSLTTRSRAEEPNSSMPTHRCRL